MLTLPFRAPDDALKAMIRHSLPTLVAYLCAAWVALAAPGRADEPTSVPEATITLPDSLTPEIISGLVARLTDDEVRQTLIEVLNREAAKAVPVPDERTGLTAFIESRAAELDRQVGYLWLGASFALVELPGVIAKWGGGRGAWGAVLDTLALAVMLTIGGAAAALVYRRSGAVRARIDRLTAGGFGARLVHALYRAMLDLAALAVFGVIAIGLILALTPGEGPERPIAISAVAAVAMPWLVAMVLRFLFAPTAPELRLIRLGDEDAGLIRRWVMRVTIVESVGWLLNAGGMALKLGYEIYFLIIASVGTVVAALIIWMI